MNFTERERRVVPTVRPEWFRLFPRSSLAFWWRVGMVVRKRRVKHADHSRVREICVEVDLEYPRKNDE
jgi:hypothetical protein